MNEIARASALRHVYPDGTTLAYSGPDFSVAQGERVGLLGANGSGKSTLLFHLMGILQATSGSVRVFGYDPAREFAAMRDKLGVLLQHPQEQIIAPTVRDDIAFTPLNLGCPPEEITPMVNRIAVDLHLDHLLDKAPHTLSGGEQLKVALAGALVMRPRLLLLDEPFERLDTLSKSELIAILNRLHAEQGISFVISTHEVNLMPLFLDKLYLLARGGAIAAVGPPAEILSRADLLYQHHIEPPVLACLFTALRQRGLSAETALTVESAADTLEQLLRRGQPDGGCNRPGQDRPEPPAAPPR